MIRMELLRGTELEDTDSKEGGEKSEECWKGLPPTRFRMLKPEGILARVVRDNSRSTVEEKKAKLDPPHKKYNPQQQCYR
jgi:hypothetical protein